ncbi:hypothetical protein [Thermosulfurimonas sp. F29]|uniref:hypothetical protein n=1 Tax=Thermosulfurimonas sp. F29 TaxID=2867247 RepID=UPI001C82E33D|nr:hypothetical protein [Thermosulfurimonas sp. F29]MBX6423385.1 hypothetical protein [Thermosulfurimonas sp. F29]
MRAKRMIYGVINALLLAPFAVSDAWAADQQTGQVSSGTIPQMVKRAAGLALWALMFALLIGGLFLVVTGFYKVASADEDPREKKAGKHRIIWGIGMGLAAIIFMGMILYLSNSAKVSVSNFGPGGMLQGAGNSPENLFQ